jgi:hypothetical protein
MTWNTFLGIGNVISLSSFQLSKQVPYLMSCCFQYSVQWYWFPASKWNVWCRFKASSRVDRYMPYCRLPDHKELVLSCWYICFEITQILCYISCMLSWDVRSFLGRGNCMFVLNILPVISGRLVAVTVALRWQIFSQWGIDYRWRFCPLVCDTM